MRNTSIDIFENRLDIILYSVSAKREISVTDIFNDVIYSNRTTILKCMSDLVELGYLTRESEHKYKATELANGLFGVSNEKAK